MEQKNVTARQDAKKNDENQEQDYMNFDINSYPLININDDRDDEILDYEDLEYITITSFQEDDEEKDKYKEYNSYKYSTFWKCETCNELYKKYI